MKEDVLKGVLVAALAGAAAGKIGVDFGGFYFFGLLVTIWLILNKCISILENVSEIGVPLPAFLLCIVQKLKKTVENAGSGAAETGLLFDSPHERGLLDKQRPLYSSRWADGKIRINDPASTKDSRVNSDLYTFRSEVKYYWWMDARKYNPPEGEIGQDFQQRNREIIVQFMYCSV